jgi:hypothetical protein
LPDEASLDDELAGAQQNERIPNRIDLDAEETKWVSNFGSLSDFDCTDSSNGSEMEELIYRTLGQDKDFETFLINHHAFQDLIADIRTLLEHYHENQLNLIRKRIMLSLRRPMKKSKYGQ